MEIRFHLQVLSECDADCKLCSALGCLRPARLTFPEFLRELDRAALECATTLVFPPNFLNHPEAAQFCFEAARRKLTPLVRLRPLQLATMSELLSTLEYRGAKFEVIVAEGISPKALESKLDFKTVLLPSTLIEPALLHDAIPFSWRVGMEVMTPLSSFEYALMPDEVFVFANERRLKPYSENQRATLGTIPGARERLERSTGLADDIRMSVVITNPESLATFDTQSFAKNFFEVILVADRASNDVIESLQSTCNLQILRMPECWGEIPARQAEAFNLAAKYARGSRLLFLSEGFPIERDLLNRCAQRNEECVRIESRTSNAVTTCALLMSLKHFFASGGFSTTEHTGFEFQSFAQNPLWILGDVDKDGIAATPPKYSKMRAQAAQDMYLTTLDRNFYAANYALMGPRPWLRRAFKLVARLGVLQHLKTFVARSRARASHMRAVKA